jgi:hypothetical protein
MLAKTTEPVWGEAIAVAVISQSEYNTALEQYNSILLQATEEDVDMVVLPQEYVALRLLISIQQFPQKEMDVVIEKKLNSSFMLPSIAAYFREFREFVESNEDVAPAGRYSLTYEEATEMYRGNYCTQLYFYGYPVEWNGKMSLPIAKKIVLDNGELAKKAIPSAKNHAKTVVGNHMRSMESKLETLRDFKEFFDNL